MARKRARIPGIFQSKGVGHNERLMYETKTGIKAFLVNPKGARRQRRS